MDIRFYTLDFSDLRILPQSSKGTGYTSMNADIEFRGNGSFKCVFHDEEIKSFVKAHPEGLLVKWGAFDGYLTDYQFKEKERWLFGSHLNSILYKYVVPNQSITDGDVKAFVKGLISSYTPIIFVDNEEDFGTATFATEDKYQHLDTVLLALAKQEDIGYRVYIKEREIYFELLKAKQNPLVLSKNNLNVYEVQEDFSNKNVAFGGWYLKSKEDDGTEVTPVWTYISTAQKTGLYMQDVVLNATTPAEAMKELQGYTAEFKTDCKTRNVEYGTDYKLGDILRYQSKSATVTKQVSKISLWHEKSTYHEEPTLTEWEVNDEG